jgi:hypothetical protein
MQKKQPPFRCVTQNGRMSALICEWKGLLSLCVIAVMAVPVFAQPLIDMVASIDSLVINADYVYVAKIIKVRDEPIPGGSKMPGFSFEVEEYLKSPMREELTPEIRQRAMFVAPPTAKYKDWMHRSCRLLIIYNDSSPHHPTVIELTPDKPDVFTAKFRLLHDLNQIVQAAKDAIERTPSNVMRLCTLRLMVPRDLYKGTRWEGSDGLLLDVPADAQLEKWATELLHDENPSNRMRAAQSLRYFKSERNAKMVAKLLNDPVSDVHYAASQTLKRWEMEVEPPVPRREE